MRSHARTWRRAGVGLCLSLAVFAAGDAAADPQRDLTAFLSYPFVNELTASQTGDRIAWITYHKGIRTIFEAQGPTYRAHAITAFAEDDGQELTQLQFSKDGKTLIFVRGGDHDANWADEKKRAPDPAESPLEPKVTIWAAREGAEAPVKVAEGDQPALSPDGRLAFVKDDQIWSAPLDGAGKPELLFFDRGKNRDPAWSPDGRSLAFVSDRADHAFIGVFRGSGRPLEYLAPSTSRDHDFVWSPDSGRIAFIRAPGVGGPPEPLLTRSIVSWSIVVADVESGEGRKVFSSPKTFEGSYPRVPGGVDLFWLKGDNLVFRAEMDGWPHLYLQNAAGGAARLLTPGPFMVEDAAPTHDLSGVLFAANAGSVPGDTDRRHIFLVGEGGGPPKALTPGPGLEWRPVSLEDGLVAYTSAGPVAAPAVVLQTLEGGERRTASNPADPALPLAKFVTPKAVTFTAEDGVLVHGQLFQSKAGAAPKPGVIFVHGGPPRQMLLGWSYMDYYAHAYAMNQYLATHGFTVLSVNYRLGIGYGRAFQEPEKAGPAGAAEYKDVVAGAKFLGEAPGVDPNRLGIWGGSYGGYLTGLALARNSDIFKAGVDLHGVHDWSRSVAESSAPRDRRAEEGDFAQAMKTAFAASPVADIATWTSPVLLIHGDDDRNVHFGQTVDLARRLEDKGAPFEELILPDEIHGFLRWSSWLKADEATVRFLTKTLKAQP